MSWISPCVKRLVGDKILPETTHAFVLCRTELLRVCKELHEAGWPKGTTHAFAEKANHISGVLKVLKEGGMGAETASMGEFCQAEKVWPCNENPHMIVFDSPMKTMDELKHVLYKPCLVNMDNFQELDRVIKLNEETPIKATIGIRINPQIGAGTMGIFSTGTVYSKFGIGLQDHKKDIIEAFKKYKFLKMLHIHTGSQGIGLEMMAGGCKLITELAEEIGDQVEYIDIGGGLAVNFGSDEYKPTFKDYVDKLKVEVPILMSGKYKVVTEFGRAVVAKAGVLASRVEYVKASGGRTIVHQHIGVDLAIRTIWAPKDWVLRVSIHDGATGDERTGNEVICDVAGPCCLGGDITAHERSLPLAQQNDIVVHKDVGGYYFSSYSYYNLRQAPAVYLYDETSDKLEQIRKATTVEETLAFMN